jgi:AcrR family transcriptional regulator
MPDTKEKIIEVCESLFFEQGIANIRLQQIADGAGISVGNLAYHFKNKDAIVTAVYENLFAELSGILSQYIVYQQLSGFNKQFSALYEFYHKNNFTFNNQWEIQRNYPEIQQEWLSAMNKILLQLKKRIEYNVENGFFKPEPWKGAYDNLTQTILLGINCWIPQQMLRNRPVKEELYKKNLWTMLYPCFTDKGIREFEQTVVPEIF